MLKNYRRDFVLIVKKMRKDYVHVAKNREEIMSTYSKTCVKQLLLKRPKIVFHYQL